MSAIWANVIPGSLHTAAKGIRCGSFRKTFGMERYAVGNLVVDQIMQRAARAKADSDFAYFFDLLLAAESITKFVTLGMLAAISDDKDRNRYRIEHGLVRADGIGDWARSIEDVLTGPASQYLLADAYPEQTQLTALSGSGTWQYESIRALREALSLLSIDAEAVPEKSDMKRWFRLFATLRNKTRAHGAIQPVSTTAPALALERSIDFVYRNLSIFRRSSVVLHRNLSGKYRVSPVAGDASPFDFLKRESTHVLSNGVYIWWGGPRLIPLLYGSPELDNFYFSNGGFTGRTFELLSYSTGDKKDGDATAYLALPGNLPPSETQGRGELLPRDNCLSNAPAPLADYVERPILESGLKGLLLDDKRPIVTLRGAGGIGKTSLALRVLEDVYKTERYVTVVWLSARDVDLQLSGPKPVRPNVISPDDMGIIYSNLVLSPEQASEKTFKPRAFFESQLQNSDTGPCLFVLDNFETTQNPIEVFTWIDAFIRLPNKVLITTRLRDFKGDYPVDVTGMNEKEAAELIAHTADYLGIRECITPAYVNEVIHQSEGHPYVIKILLGEIAKTRRTGNVQRLIAGSDEVLTALFERTYSALSPCAQRAFLTLSAWMSSVPRLALEAVLLRSTQERNEVEAGIETLLQYSLAESYVAPADGQEFIALPLVAAIFGKKKLAINPYRLSILADIDLLQMLGPSRRDDVRLSLARKLETFLSRIAKQVELGQTFMEFKPILEMICRHYPPGWLLLARWHIESATAEDLEKAKVYLNLFLESRPENQQAAEAWRQLADVCFRSGDTLGEMHAFVERAQIADVPFHDVSSTANRLNEVFREQGLEIRRDEKQALAQRLASVMKERIDEADADDLSRMAWLSIHLGQEAQSHEYVRAGLRLDPTNYHCQRLARRLGLPVANDAWCEP